MITPEVVASIYGVVIADGRIDEEATRAQRRLLRVQRLGSPPAREPEPMVEYRPALRVQGGSFECNHCGAELGLATGNWKESAASGSWPLPERAAELGTKVRPATSREMRLWELYCPQCATLLEAEICDAGEPPGHDIRLGVVSDAEGEPF